MKTTQRLKPALLALLLSFGLPGTGSCEAPSAEDLLARFAQSAPLEFRYRETRKLELMDRPWKGSGYLYSTPEGTLVKLQIEPERLIMAIAGDSLYYYDSASLRRQSAALSQAGPMGEQIKAFRAIVQGRSQELAPLYSLRSDNQAGRWRLALATKAPAQGGAPARIEISGDEKRKSRRQVHIVQADGEETDYAMEQGRAGPEIELAIRRLLSEAKGN
ncbi:outer membrane lipoprotein carrier protein LolA [Methylococcus sp. EFPC2]|uniref:outer membrane lipoprotein carrier protein LolA n=1 Tax=Methylococcus sp. EFPC2 TaxID=2812648 RepID=UPI0019686AF6|nr:outer membrane lipoprotein carrier protein LolA [Methylococcus sp. EFPC2]QSA98865.1 outer membrane lipoprotein carrier protein LolA [Methylococcus sp. EFPC2]